MQTARSAALAALVVLLLSILATAVAHAHAVLVASEPADGAVLAAPPGRVTLTFNEPVSPLVMKLVGPGGVEQKMAGVTQEGATLIAVPDGALRDGTHLLSWRVVSADGHPVGGTVTFSIGHAGEAPPSADSAGVPAGMAGWLARIVIYVAMFVGVGGAFFVCWFGGGPVYAVERVLYATLAAGLLTVPLSLGLHGADLLGVSLAQFGEPAVWRAGILSPYIATAVLAFAAIFAARLAFAATSRRRAKLASAIGFVCVGAALAASGHASVASPQWLMRPAVFIHALGIAFWIGALLPLAGLLLARPRDVRMVLSGFSRIAPCAIAALIASGAVLAVVQLGGVPALWETNYGRLLLAKFGLLAVLFSIALYSRFVLSGRVAANDPAAGHALARLIAVEVVLALAIFSVAASWRFTPPPRALAAAAATPASVHIHTGRAMADVKFEPGRAGRTAVSIVLMTTDFGPLDAKEVQLVLSFEASGIGPIHRPALKGTDGVWRIDAMTVPMPGRWTVRVDVLIDDFEKIWLDEAVEFRP